MMRYGPWIVMGMLVLLAEGALAETGEPQPSTVRAFPIHNGPKNFPLAPTRLMPLNLRASQAHSTTGESSRASSSQLTPVLTSKTPPVARVIEPAVEKPLTSERSHASAAMGEEEAKQILSLFGPNR